MTVFILFISDSFKVSHCFLNSFLFISSSTVKLEEVLHDSELARCVDGRVKRPFLMLSLCVFFPESVVINLGLNLAFFNLSPA